MTDHPSSEQLRSWLRGDEAEVLGHVEECESCLSELEKLSRLDITVVEALELVTKPVPGFVDRVLAAIERRQQDAEAWSALTDLFSLGWRTIDTMWGNDG